MRRIDQLSPLPINSRYVAAASPLLKASETEVFDLPTEIFDCSMNGWSGVILPSAGSIDPRQFSRNPELRWSEFLELGTSGKRAMFFATVDPEGVQLTFMATSCPEFHRLLATLASDMTNSGVTQYLSSRDSASPTAIEVAFVTTDSVFTAEEALCERLAEEADLRRDKVAIYMSVADRSHELELLLLSGAIINHVIPNELCLKNGVTIVDVPCSSLLKVLERAGSQSGYFSFATRSTIGMRSFLQAASAFGGPLTMSAVDATHLVKRQELQDDLLLLLPSDEIVSLEWRVAARRVPSRSGAMYSYPV